MKCEIINPHDKTTIEHDDFAPLCMATILLGRGAYGLQCDNGKSMPILLFSKDVDNMFFLEEFGKGIDDFMNDVNDSDVVTALRSVRSASKTSTVDLEKNAAMLADAILKRMELMEGEG
jgi:hypothetical protein